MYELQKEKLAEFLKRWTLQAVENMALENYISTGENTYETFAYWVEYYTRCLGDIGSSPATKFGIYQQCNVKDNLPNGCEKDKNNYVWHTWLAKQNKTGKDLGLKGAFKYVKQRIILPIIKNARKGIFNDIEIEESNCVWGLVKWKIAFLYQDFDNIKILPVYSKNALAKYLEISDKSKTMLDLYNIAIKKKNIKTLDGVFNFPRKVFPKKYLLIDNEIYKGNGVTGQRTPSSHPPKVVGKYSTSHSDMQIKLRSILEEDDWKVLTEATHRKDISRIDLVAMKDDKKQYYEVKPYEKACDCIREAFGQLMEYWHYGKSDRYKKADQLFIVGPNETDELDDIFLNDIRKNHNIPIYYLQIKI